MPSILMLSDLFLCIRKQLRADAHAGKHACHQGPVSEPMMLIRMLSCKLITLAGRGAIIPFAGIFYPPDESLFHFLRIIFYIKTLSPARKRNFSQIYYFQIIRYKHITIKVFLSLSSIGFLAYINGLVLSMIENKILDIKFLCLL